MRESREDSRLSYIYGRVLEGKRMETEEILARIKEADMVLVGLGEDFDDASRLRDCGKYVKGSGLLRESGCHWLLPAWREHCSAQAGEDRITPALGKLADVLGGKNYFVVSVATDSRVAAAPWRDKRLVMPCGTASRKQCRQGCGCGVEELTAADRRRIESFCEELSAGRLPPDAAEGLARCGVCGAGMVLNNIFAENYNEQGYMEQWECYRKWLQGTLNRRLLVLELGAGLHFPSVIRWPFEKIVYFHHKAVLIRVHETLCQLAEELAGKGHGISKNAIAWLERL